MGYSEPDFLPWDGRRVPLTLLGGYLGAGKTTLINELLARTTRPLAVIVNDVGAINVDAALIKARSGDTIEFTDGCVCCSLSDGMGAAFDQLRARPVPPEQVVVELSGLAEPVRVAPWGRSAGFMLDGIVVVADAQQILEQLEQPQVGSAIASQLSTADLIVTSKTDLVDQGQLDAVTARMAAVAAGVPVVNPRTALAGAALLELGGRFEYGEIPPPTLFDHHEITTVAVPGLADRDSLERFLDEALAEGSGAGVGPVGKVVRAKAIVEVADGSQLLVQVVGRSRKVTEVPQAESTRPSGLVVIRLRPEPPRGL